MSYSISTWKDKGVYVEYSPFNHKLFALSLGKEDANVDQTLLLIHGFPEASFSFHKVVNDLLNQFDRIILLDLLGYGFSDKPTQNYSYSLLEQADTVLTVWNHFGIKGGHILAHDMGDSVTTEILARHENNQLPHWFSEGIQSITFTNGSMVLGLADLRFTQKLLISKYGSTFNRITNFKLFSHQIKSAHGNSNLTNEDIQSLWELNKLQNGHHKAYLTIQYLSDRKRFETTRWLPALGQTKLPIHLCWGNDDAVAKIKMAHYLKKEICQHATLSVMENTGHFCQLGNATKWLEKVLPFYLRNGNTQN